MGRRNAGELAATAPADAIRSTLRWFFWFVIGLAALLVAIWLFTMVEQALISDPRFTLAGPPDPGTVSDFFRIEGTRHVSDEQIANVFARDFGRSIYLCQIAERRRRLLAIDWVKDASVSRFWPNRIVVRISERTPVAFVQRPAEDGTMTFSLVDADGVLLNPERVSKMTLPVLTGIPKDEPETARRERVKHFLRLQQELGEYMAGVSEVDVGEADNLKIVQPFAKRAVTLMLGNQKFRERLESFLNNRDEIRQRMPRATILDVRLKGRITAVGEKDP